MTLPFVATLITDRPIERGVNYFGPTEQHVKNLAKSWLEANGQYGDSFSICEVVRMECSVVDCDKPMPEPLPPRAPKKGHHAFQPAKYGIRCDKCNALEEEHQVE